MQVESTIVTPTNINAIKKGDVIRWGQTFVRVESNEYVGNNGVRKVFGHSGAQGGAVSHPITEFFNKGQSVDKVVRF